ncbi:hypothetical protein PIB30_019940 [Stylosanthes scabra]|uniref:Uncharacterized protein n=1 Tax=Stylosanthes scabra TaxID=79078 RepID=A0ABU6W9F3_9FABA|nr:hypothetical protein [Stylosanthes scabra]
MQEILLEHASSGKFSVCRMSMDHRLFLYMISYVLLPRKRNHGTTSEEDLILLWAMIKEKQIHWPYLIAHRMLKYSQGQDTSSLGNVMLLTKIFEFLHFDLPEEEAVTLGKANAITQKNIN